MTPISIVIAARDMEPFIGATLRSALEQSHGPAEIIVVDDGSQDGTAALCAAMARVDDRIRVAPGPERGVSAARNFGASLTTGGRILFLDADDLLVSDALALLSDRLDAAPQAVAAVGRIRRIAEDGAPLDAGCPPGKLPEGDVVEALLAKNFIVNGGALLIDAAAFARTGGYPEGLRYGEDWEFWCRLALDGPIIAVQDAATLLYRQRARGANYRAREGLLATDVPALDRIARNAAFQQRFGARLSGLLRRRRIDVFWAGVRSEFELGSSLRAVGLCAAGVILYPDSLLRPRLVWRFLQSLYGVRRAGA